MALEPSGKKATLKTIAEITGLAVTTVSKALKDAPDIKQSTKDRVRQVSEQVGYRPHRGGSSLRTGKTYTISLVLGMEEEFSDMLSGLMIGISEAVKESPYHVVLTPYWFEDDPMEPIRSIVSNHEADGIILSHTALLDERIAYLHEAGIPFVTHGRSDMGVEHAYCDFDSLNFAFESVKLLAGKGSERICLITPPVNLAVAQFLSHGFEKGLEENGLDGSILEEITMFDSVERIADEVESMMSKKTRPDGFICASTRSAVGVMGGVEKAGYAVGKDVNIVAKQSLANMLKWLGRDIIDIQEDFRHAGHTMGSSLLKIIDGESVSSHQKIIFPADRGRSVLR